MERNTLILLIVICVIILAVSILVILLVFQEKIKNASDTESSEETRVVRPERRGERGPQGSTGPRGPRGEAGGVYSASGLWTSFANALKLDDPNTMCVTVTNGQGSVPTISKCTDSNGQLLDTNNQLWFLENVPSQNGYYIKNHHVPDLCLTRDATGKLSMETCNESEEQLWVWNAQKKICTNTGVGGTNTIKCIQFDHEHNSIGLVSPEQGEPHMIR